MGHRLSVGDRTLAIGRGVASHAFAEACDCSTLRSSSSFGRVDRRRDGELRAWRRDLDGWRKYGRWATSPRAAAWSGSPATGCGRREGRSRGLAGNYGGATPMRSPRP